MIIGRLAIVSEKITNQRPISGKNSGLVANVGFDTTRR